MIVSRRIDLSILLAFIRHCSIERIGWEPIALSFLRHAEVVAKALNFRSSEEKPEQTKIQNTFNLGGHCFLSNHFGIETAA